MSCQRKAYNTSIAVRNAIRVLGLKPKPRDAEFCKGCGRWHIREGLL